MAALWHAGTRFDYLYRPALPYGTVVISMATGYEPAKAYHAYTALFLLRRNRRRLFVGPHRDGFARPGRHGFAVAVVPAAQRLPGRWNRPSRLSRLAVARLQAYADVVERGPIKRLSRSARGAMRWR